MLTDLPLPEWLARLTVESMQCDPFPLTEILEGSLYYPACCFDGDPVKYLLGKVHRFIYVDYGVDQNDLTEALDRTGFSGYECVGRREVSQKELCPRGWTPEPPRAGERRYVPDGWIKKPFCSWLVFQKKESDPRAPNKERFSLLYLCADGAASYQALYTSNRTFPAGIAVIQPGAGFGGNYTNFEDPQQILYRSVLGNPAGQPHFLFNGGNGDPHFYDNPCWPHYSDRLGTFERHRGSVINLWSLPPGQVNRSTEFPGLRSSRQN